MSGYDSECEDCVNNGTCIYQDADDVESCIIVGGEDESTGFI